MADDKTLDPTSNVDYKGKISENFHDEHWVGLPLKEGLKWFFLGDGITTITPKYTDKTKTAAYYDGGGNEQKTITGMTPSYDISGDRSKGNPTQDLIANRKYRTGSGRNLIFRRNEFLENENGTFTLIKSEYGMASYSDIDDGGGTADDNGSFKFSVQYLSTPKLVNAKDAQQLDNILHQTPCQNASILGVNVEQPQTDGKVQIYSPDMKQVDGDIDYDGSKPATITEAREEAGSAVSPVVPDDGTDASQAPETPTDVKSEATGNGANVNAN